MLERPKVPARLCALLNYPALVVPPRALGLMILMHAVLLLVGKKCYKFLLIYFTLCLYV
jgi:hypothetical protein